MNSRTFRHFFINPRTFMAFNFFFTFKGIKGHSTVRTMQYLNSYVYSLLLFTALFPLLPRRFIFWGRTTPFFTNSWRRRPASAFSLLLRFLSHILMVKSQTLNLLIVKFCFLSVAILFSFTPSCLEA